MSSDGVSLVRVGDAIVLMIEMFPTAFMLALDTEQALRLADGLREAVAREGDSGTGNMLDKLLKGAGKKPSGEN